jgi:hypothetical protein
VAKVVLMWLLTARSEPFLSFGNFFGFDNVLFRVSSTFSLSSSFAFVAGWKGYSNNNDRFDDI